MATGGGLTAPVINTYISPTSGVETAPVGAANVVIEVWGGGGGGELGSANLCSGTDGDGGGSGGYSRSSYAITGLQTLNFFPGHGGAKGATFPSGNGNDGVDSTVTSGTLTIAAMTAPGGGGGGLQPGGGLAGTTGTGGNVANAAGNDGGDATLGNSSGGAAVVGVHDTGGKGGNGGVAGVSTSGTGGTSGKVVFYYT